VTAAFHNTVITTLPLSTNTNHLQKQAHIDYENMPKQYKLQLEMCNAQRDGRPAEYRWRPLFNAAKFG